ncbi:MULTISPECIES: hypothetical protein [Pseudoalteromonas]|uniref:Uncharacterized protein n=1 Tax=Pseudoalteromonas luteoviolacea (strain 2ta16) TaxID=1353533 RepID=V4HT93_PSEL2|nr:MULTISPECIES: hypothetical protein [Pseudoalteromonas]ESP94035.1 hypothetical protein PL2TA16_02559 [Pseudoalteromonas luteoviolacea 2ta16]KZN33477.1 hypothetical protein N483_02370 [Pseudoalteromonas luteoviolacea NCIMB 1944]MCG7548936.1 hypothetical protein [Pseudoalteromonas sp. Of7M-16]
MRISFRPIILFLTLHCSFLVHADDSAVSDVANVKEQAAERRIAGLWHDVNNSNFANGHLIVSQQGSEIFTAHYLEFKGIPFVEHGAGKREQDTITVKVQVTQQIPGWTTEGVHTLTLSDDGQYLIGEYFSGGNKGPLKFKKAGK